MSFDEKRKYSCLKINDPASAQQVIADVVNEILESGDAVEKAGTISNMINTYLKAYQVAEIEKITARLDALEAAKNGCD